MSTRTGALALISAGGGDESGVGAVGLLGRVDARIPPIRCRKSRVWLVSNLSRRCAKLPRHFAVTELLRRTHDDARKHRQRLRNLVLVRPFIN